jgi:hypothetical protein
MGASGLVAGPWTTEPSVMLNLLPWQGQLIVPFETLLTKQPSCVQIALNALNDPDCGCVITILSASMILPPPSGTWEVAARAVATGALPLAEVAVALAAGVNPPLLASCVLHPASIAAHVTPAPASSARRLGSSRRLCESWLSWISLIA